MGLDPLLVCRRTRKMQKMFESRHTCADLLPLKMKWSVRYVAVTRFTHSVPSLCTSIKPSDQPGPPNVSRNASLIKNGTTENSGTLATENWSSAFAWNFFESIVRGYAEAPPEIFVFWVIVCKLHATRDEVRKHISSQHCRSKSEPATRRTRKRSCRFQTRRSQWLLPGRPLCKPAGCRWSPLRQ